MSVNLPINKERIRNHWQYSAWKYLLLIALSLLCVNLICTVTAPRVPEELKIEFCVEGFIPYEFEKLNDEWIEQVKQDVLPGMEEVTLLSLGSDEMTTDQLLLVKLASAEGDVYLLSKERFKRYSAEGAMMDLQPLIDQSLLHVDGFDLQEGYVTAEESGASVLCGIPADTLTGLFEYGIDVRGKVLSILVANGNEENAVKFADYLLTAMRK